MQKESSFSLAAFPAAFLRTFLAIRAGSLAKNVRAIFRTSERLVNALWIVVPEYVRHRLRHSVKRGGPSLPVCMEVRMHRQGFPFVCLLLACAIAITPTQAQPQIALTANTTSVEGAYATFRKALEAADAKSASALVTKSTLDEYEKCRKLALSSSDTDFSELNQLSVLMVFNCGISYRDSNSNR